MLEAHIKDIDSDAVCQEIGERLARALGPQSELPAHLLALIERLAKSGTPSEIRPDLDA